MVVGEGGVCLPQTRLRDYLCSSRWLHIHAHVLAGIRKKTQFNKNTKDAHKARRKKCREVKDGEGIGEGELVRRFEQ